MNKLADSSSVENVGSSFPAEPILNEHGAKLFSPDWSNNSQIIAFGVRSLSGNLHIHFMINSYSGSLEFELPGNIEKRRYTWKRWADTSLESPGDISEMSQTPSISEKVYNLCPYSMAILIDLK